MKKTLWGKVAWNYWLTFWLTFLAGRLTFLLTFSYMHSFCLLFAAAGSCSLHGYWFLLVFNTVFWYAGSCCWLSWLLKPFSAYVRLTFCLRFSYVKNGPYETLRKSMFGQQDHQRHVETHWLSKARCLTSKYNTTPASRAIRIGPYRPYQNQSKN